ncbi:MAG: hypothetical protein NZ585_03900 [Chloracidobacterium sp.]|nr:hypothetical protein [Chloracidobacterium sp.]MDW8217500.1 hypothetical protein [Acidobacteriota bacterium]
MHSLFQMRHRLFYAGVVLLVIAGALVVAANRRANADDGLALARIMPKGALAYVQARDFSDLFARWRKSQVHDRYYASDSYRAFRRSRLWAKLNERLNEFETGVGLTLTEDVIAQMAGKATAVALYDMGKLELAFITELSAAQAAATPLLARKATFEVRTTPGGQAYLVRELATDGGRLRQGLCVATPPGKLIVTTTEALMQRALDNLGGRSGDDLLTTMAPTLAIADGFTPHDLTLWTDLPRLRKQVYFSYYWIHGAAATDLDGIEATLADVEFTGDGVQERRWSLTAGRPVPAAFTAQSQPMVERLLDAAPFAVVETLQNDAPERAARLAAQAVLPPLRLMIATKQLRLRDIEDIAGDAAKRGRYQRLDARFDRDLDDPNAPVTTAGKRPVSSSPLTDPLETELANLFRAAQPTYLARLGETVAEGGSPFVAFERAVAIRCARPFDAKAYEAAIARAVGRRFFIAGTMPSFEWQTLSSGVTTLRVGASLERCGAYFVSDDLVVIARSAAYAEQLKARLTAAGQPDRPAYNPSAYRQAVVRLRALAPGYRQVVRMIGSAGVSGLTPLEEDAVDEPVAFLEQNILSLLTVVEQFDTVTIESAAGEGRLFERVRYEFIR